MESSVSNNDRLFFITTCRSQRAAANFSLSCTHLMICVNKVARACSVCVCLCGTMSVCTKHTFTATVNCLKFAVMVTYTDMRGKDDAW